MPYTALRVETYALWLPVAYVWTAVMGTYTSAPLELASWRLTLDHGAAFPPRDPARPRQNVASSLKNSTRATPSSCIRRACRRGGGEVRRRIGLVMELQPHSAGGRAAYPIHFPITLDDESHGGSPSSVGALLCQPTLSCRGICCTVSRSGRSARSCRRRMGESR
jgi:hypothetical protein